MIKAFKWQFKLMVNKLNFKTAFTAMMILCVGYTVYNALIYSSNDRTTSVDSTFAYVFYGSNQLLSILVILLPVIAVLPFSTIHTSNRALHLPALFLTRFGMDVYKKSRQVKEKGVQ